MSSLFATSSVSKQSTATTYDTKNEQVGVSGGGTAIGSNSSGNVIKISTTDSADLHASLLAATDIAGTSLAAANSISGRSLSVAENVSGMALSAAVQSLHDSNATAQAGFRAGADVAGAAIASNYNITQGASNIANKAIEAVTNSGATQAALLSGVMMSFQNALSASNAGAQGLAAGALNQASQIVGGVGGVAVDTTPYETGIPHPLTKKQEIAIAAVAVVVIFFAMKKAA